MIDGRFDDDASNLRTRVIGSVPFPEGCDDARRMILQAIDRTVQTEETVRA